MSDLRKRTLIGLAACLLATQGAEISSAFAQAATRPALVNYRPMGADKDVQLRPYVGRNIALLLDPERSPDRVVTDRIVSAIDRAWDWYRNMFGRAPTPNRVHAGKSTIAEIAKPSCGGAACGLLGYTGIELGSDSMNRLILEANLDRYNQAVFYELGRNFWFFADQLATLPEGAFTTGFAHVNRFYSMEASGLVGAPWDDNLDFDGLRYAALVDLMDRYLADPKLTWQNTLATGKVPANPHSWISVPHLGGAFFHRIRRDHGYAGYRQFWQLMAKAPKSTTPRDAIVRFVQVAYAATGQDYRDLMRDQTLQLK
jgi:serralysin